MPRPTRTGQFRRQPLTSEEASRLANAAETPDEKLVIFTLLDTGLRVAELAAVKRHDVEWQGKGYIRAMGKGGPFGKRSKLRIVPMTPRVRALLEHYFALRDTLNGLSKRTIQRIVQRVAKRAAITRPCSAHVLRHTFAILALQGGVSLEAVRALLGHDHITTTAIYLNLTPHQAVEEFYAKVGHTP
jgi:integrase/recombinase XerD